MRYGIWAPIPQWVGGTRKWTAGRNWRRMTAVVIHRMDGTLDGSDGWLRREYDQYGNRLSASTHFAVGAWGWINRSLHRYQTRQWVDTLNTAYGWAARPTDTPTSLARATLGGDLYNPAADLNWQVIHVEVEGWSHQLWPRGITTRVAELLTAIGRAHGPLVIMAHTDISSKPCPGMSTVPWGSIGGYGGRISQPALPDTTTPPKDELPVKFRPVHNRKFLFRKGTTFRSSPKYPASNAVQVLKSDSYRNVVGYTLGSSLSGSSRWVAFWDANDSTGDQWDGQWLYAHEADVLKHAKIEG